MVPLKLQVRTVEEKILENLGNIFESVDLYAVSVKILVGWLLGSGIEIHILKTR